MMNLQNKIDSIMQYEDIGGIIAVVFIVICCIIAFTNKDKPSQKGGYSLLVLFVGCFIVLFVVCNLGGDAV